MASTSTITSVAATTTRGVISINGDFITQIYEYFPPIKTTQTSYFGVNYSTTSPLESLLINPTYTSAELLAYNGRDQYTSYSSATITVPNPTTLIKSVSLYQKDDVNTTLRFVTTYDVPVSLQFYPVQILPTGVVNNSLDKTFITTGVKNNNLSHKSVSIIPGNRLCCVTSINSKIVKNSNPDVIPASTQVDRAVNAIKYGRGGKTIFGNIGTNTNGDTRLGQIQGQTLSPFLSRNKF